jgi:hypothetical protein
MSHEQDHTKRQFAFAMGSHARLGQSSIIALLPADVIQKILSPVTTGICHLYDCYREIARYSLDYEAQCLFKESYGMRSDEECSDSDEEYDRLERFETEVDESITSATEEFSSKIRPIERKYEMAIAALQPTDCEGLGTLIDVIQESIRNIGHPCTDHDFEIGKRETKFLEAYLGVPRMKSLCRDGHTDSPVVKLWALERLKHVDEGSHRRWESEPEHTDNSGLDIGFHFARYICEDMPDSESGNESE